MKGNDGCPPVVITGLCDAMSLYLIRSFGKRGIPVIGVDSNISSYYSKSRHCSKVKCDSLFDSTLIHCLRRIAYKLPRRPVLFNCTDQSVLNVSKNRELIDDIYHFVLPSHQTIEMLMSKKQFYEFATKKSFLVPKTCFSSTPEELNAIRAEIEYPCIIKPEYRDRKWAKKVPTKVIFVKSHKDFERYVKAYKIENMSLIIQEWIDGDDGDVYFCLAYLNRLGSPICVVPGRKLRQHPHLSGSTALAKTEWIPEVVSESKRLLLSARSKGFCSVEFKRSKKNGKFYIMEPTIGRPDSQQGICLAAGVDIPYIAYKDAFEETESTIKDAGEVVSHGGWIEESRLWYSIKDYLRGDYSRSELLEFLSGKKAFALLDFHDPMPIINFGIAKGKSIITNVIKGS